MKLDTNAWAIVGVVAIVLIVVIQGSLSGLITGDLHSVTAYHPNQRFGAFGGIDVISCFSECENFVYGTPDHRDCYTDCLRILREYRRRS